jgi:SAM-dependent methyltransferase
VTPRPANPSATDWDSYYQSVPATAKLTRKYTTAALLRAIRRYAGSGKPLSIVEIGGANSCFLDSILEKVPCRSYEVIDTNEYGLSLLRRRLNDSRVVHLHQESVLALPAGISADVVFSVGLVEHFDPARTREAVLAHFDLLRPGGIAVITFPTPTWLYRGTRRAIEAMGMWKFHDERPLKPGEVLSAIRERGEVLCERTLWPLVLTQYLVVAKKPDR